MFTGLVADLGTVAEIRTDEDGAQLTIHTALADEIHAGDSIAVGGVCLTATSLDGEGFTTQAMHETLRRSALGRLVPGAQVNVELALRADARLGGHVVQGHVDGMGSVAAVTPDGFSRVVRVEPDDPALLRYVVLKGSIAIDGVSLTVSALDEVSLSVSLIPETLERTTLGTASAGTRVNLEVDVLAKHVERLMSATTVGT
ncbi:MAG TPA: riboflavin synthase [Solirubrobacteraceae bacterium]|nr:riboflavin synthase [Solirubrobacteraceae bacterium]